MSQSSTFIQDEKEIMPYLSTIVTGSTVSTTWTLWTWLTLDTTLTRETSLALEKVRRRREEQSQLQLHPEKWEKNEQDCMEHRKDINLLLHQLDQEHQHLQEHPVMGEKARHNQHPELAGRYTTQKENQDKTLTGLGWKRDWA